VWRYAAALPGDRFESWVPLLGIAVAATIAAAYGLGQMLNCRST
jgi:hypothetical protein